MFKVLFRNLHCIILITATISCPWDLVVTNDTHDNTTVNVHLYWASIFCREDHFYLSGRESKTIRAGLCDLIRAVIDDGDGLEFTKATGNPVNGLTIQRQAGRLKVIRNP